LMEKIGGVFSHEFTLTKDVSPSKSVYWVDISNSGQEYHAFIMTMVIVLSCVQRLPGNPLATAHAGNAKISLILINNISRDRIPSVWK
jgi:hypothetical protein